MSALHLIAAPLTSEAFEPFGEVIGATAVAEASMNDARFDRYDRLCRLDIDGEVSVGIVQSRVASSLPYRINAMERHPRGSQAFVPLSPFRFVVVVAAAGKQVAVDDLRAYISDGHQGINYARGTWHMPLIAMEVGRRFLVIERADPKGNCDVQHLRGVALLELPRDASQPTHPRDL